MKKIIPIALIYFLFSSFSSAQISIGVLGGIQTINLSNKSINISNKEGLDDFVLTAQNSDLGIHFGVFTRLQLGSFFLQPEFIFNSNKVNYKWDEIYHTGSTTQFLSETYQYLDIPLKLGVKKGIFVVHTGPVGHYFINSSSELWAIKDYDQKFSNLKWSWEMGIGIEVLFLKLDIHYEKDLTPFGDHIVLFGNQYEFDNSAAKWVASVYFSI